MKNRILITLFVLTAISISGFSQKRTVKTKLSITENTFYIKSSVGKLYLDLPGGGVNAQSGNGSNVQLWAMDNGADRRVKFIDRGNGFYNIQFQHAKVNLDVNGCFDGDWFCGTYKKDRGANIQIWSAGNSKPQQWHMEQITPGKFRIVNRYSGKSLNAAGGSGHKNGTNICQWTWGGGQPNELWEIIDVKTGAKFQL